MGSIESKTEISPKLEGESEESVIKESTPSTPILTPLDPRSPSVNIARTPLDLILTSKRNECDSDKVKDDSGIPPDDVNIVLGIDPRSPTVEFNRTPIIVAAVNKEKPTVVKNKNLDNVRKNEIQTTPIGTARKSANIPVKLLESSPVAVASNHSSKRKSLVGLLETNIDYTETNLDTVCQNKSNLNHCLPPELTETVPDNKLKNELNALQMESSEYKSQHCELLNINVNELNINDLKISDEKIINVTAQVKDFDKKLTNLIYQDDSEDDHEPNLRLARAKENNRTPLSVRNCNEDLKKVQSRLKVSDKPRRSEGSRIPVLKNNASRKIGIQCENTPPSKAENIKQIPKMPQWDADKTIII